MEATNVTTPKAARRESSTVTHHDWLAAKAAYDRGDYATELQIYRRLVEKGDVRAQDNLGIMYENGRGVRQDYAEAMAWYRRAADRGDAAAQFNVGTMYHNGRGVAQNHAEAAKWYRWSADQGNAVRPEQPRRPV